VTDIFREVEEDVRRERFEKIWKEYGDYIIAGASLLVIAAAGYRLWLFYDARERARASTEFAVAQQLMDGGQSQAAAEAFGKLAQSAPRGYAKISQLEEADALLAAGNKSDATTLYRKLMADSDEIVAAIARIRLAWAVVDDTPRGDMVTMLAPLTAAGSPWRAPAGEILAYADYRGGAMREAIAEYKRLAADQKAPPHLRERAQAMATFLGAGGDANVGTVPMPQARQPGPVQPGPVQPGPVPVAPANAAPAPAQSAAPAASHATAPAKPASSTPQGQPHK